MTTYQFIPKLKKIVIFFFLKELQFLVGPTCHKSMLRCLSAKSSNSQRRDPKNSRREAVPGARAALLHSLLSLYYSVLYTCILYTTIVFRNFYTVTRTQSTATSVHWHRDEPKRLKSSYICIQPMAIYLWCLIGQQDHFRMGHTCVNEEENKRSMDNESFGRWPSPFFVHQCLRRSCLCFMSYLPFSWRLSVS